MKNSKKKPYNIIKKFLLIIKIINLKKLDKKIKHNKLLLINKIIQS